MQLKKVVFNFLKRTAFGKRLVNDGRYRVVIKAVIGLIWNFLFALYNGILGAMKSSVIFVTSSVYYLLLSSVRFSVVTIERNKNKYDEQKGSAVVGVFLVVLGVLFQGMVFVSMKYKTPVDYGTIPMITIATYTFTKITTAAFTANKHKNDATGFFVR